MRLESLLSLTETNLEQQRKIYIYSIMNQARVPYSQGTISTVSNANDIKFMERNVFSY